MRRSLGLLLPYSGLLALAAVVSDPVSQTGPLAPTDIPAATSLLEYEPPGPNKCGHYDCPAVNGMNISLSISGQTRTYDTCLPNHLQMVLQPNPGMRFSVLLAFEGGADSTGTSYQADDINATWLSTINAQSNVDSVQVLLIGPATQCANLSMMVHNATRVYGLCTALWKQWNVLGRLAELGSHRYDWYLHMRYDLAFDRPFVLTDELLNPKSLYVARGVVLKTIASGDIDDQLANPITWKWPGRSTAVSLNDSVSDFMFAGDWNTVALALDRYTIYIELLRQVQHRDPLRPVENLIVEPELFLSRALAVMGIEFGHSNDTYSVYFVHPFVSLVRTNKTLEEALNGAFSLNAL